MFSVLWQRLQRVCETQLRPCVVPDMADVQKDAPLPSLVVAISQKISLSPLCSGHDRHATCPSDKRRSKALPIMGRERFTLGLTLVRG